MTERYSCKIYRELNRTLESNGIVASTVGEALDKIFDMGFEIVIEHNYENYYEWKLLDSKGFHKKSGTGNGFYDAFENSLEYLIKILCDEIHRKDQ